MSPNPSIERKSDGRRERSPFRGDEIHLQVLKACLRDRDRNAWNRWRKHNADVVPDLRGVVLVGAPLARWNFSRAVLDGANLMFADLRSADLRCASLRKAKLILAALCNAKAGMADFSGANCRQAHFESADCRGADFRGSAYLAHSNLTEADFRGAHLDGASLGAAILRRTKLDDATLCKADLGDVLLDETSLNGADLRAATVGGALIRRVRTDASTKQHGLFVDLHMAWERKRGERVIVTEADDLRVAQFHNVVDEPGSVGKLLAATTQRVVLLLGRFSRGRKAVLHALARALSNRGKIAVIFDFPAPTQREISDTVRFIAAMSEFIVVDLTNATSVPLELQATAPDLMVPVLPVLQAGHRSFSMLADLQRRYFWIQPTVVYQNKDDLVRHIDDALIARATQAAQLIEDRRAAAHVPLVLKHRRSPKPR